MWDEGEEAESKFRDIDRPASVLPPGPIPPLPDAPPALDDDEEEEPAPEAEEDEWTVVLYEEEESRAEIIGLIPPDTF